MKGTKLFHMQLGDRSLNEDYNEHLVINEDPEASELADLVSIRSDLSGASEACRLYVEEAEDSNNADITRLRVFFESAIISYARPFTSGKGSGERRTRRKIDGLLVSLSEESRRAHDRAVNIRNMHVGHRVDPAEQSAVVLAAFDRQTYKFKSVSPILVDRIDSHVILDLVPCVGEMLGLLDDEISREIDELTQMYQTLEDNKQLELPYALTAKRQNLRGSSAEIHGDLGSAGIATIT